VHGNFNKRQEKYYLEVKMSEEVIPQVSKFVYLESILQNNEKITHTIQVGWLKWKKTLLEVICGGKIPTKLEDKFYLLLYIL